MAVNNLRSWFAHGRAVGALLPVLQTYLGHSPISDTAYYLHLTAESHPTSPPESSRSSATSSRPPWQARAMATDFAVCLRRFLTGHLAGLRGYSPNTIASYRDAFKLLICYFRDQQSTPPERLTLERIDAVAITGFLDWLRTSRGNSASTCNQRLAAIDSFFTWMQTQDPARMACCQGILAIPASRHDRPAVAHLSVEQTRHLLAAPDRSTRAGRRDATLLATLYDTAARVQELAEPRSGTRYPVSLAG